MSDLAALCGASLGKTHADAAACVCHGFLMGVGQCHAATHPVGGPRPPLFCPPNPPPSLAQVAAGFAAWARNNPQFANERAVDGLARWAQATFPCPAAAATAAPRRAAASAARPSPLRRRRSPADAPQRPPPPRRPGATLGLGACGNSTLTGAGLGAATGGAIGSLTADFGWGALIGAGVGAAGGYLYDQSTRSP